MSKLANFPSANPPAQSKPEQYLQHIVKESDFNDLLTYSAKQDLFSLRSKLEESLRSFGTVRNPLVDLCRARLSQLRSFLALA
ncbi:hypothetical protein D3C71_21870 [compost metagenome]